MILRSNIAAGRGTTLHDFAVLLGEEGVRLINEYAVKWAVEAKPVEFGLSWGITRLRGGFLLATLAKSSGEPKEHGRFPEITRQVIW